MPIRIHPTADISLQAIIGDGTSIWHQAQVREYAQIGKNCIIGKGVYIDHGVNIGDNVKIQNYVSVFHGVHIYDGVLVGPHVCFTNDLKPRAIDQNGSPKLTDDWEVSITTIGHGVSIGANSTIICGNTIGKWSMIGSGSVVTHNIPDYGLVYGNPARLHGFVCPCGKKLEKVDMQENMIVARCPDCVSIVKIPIDDWEKIT